MGSIKNLEIELTLLTEEDIIGKKTLGIFKKEGIKSRLTDYAIIKSDCMPEHTNNKRDRDGSYILKDRDDPTKFKCVDADGNIYTNINGSEAVRIAIYSPYFTVESLKPILSYYDRDIYLFGMCPTYVPSSYEYVKNKLERNYSENKLSVTDNVFWGNIYDYDNRKYIRIKTTKSFAPYNDTSCYYANSTFWIELKDVEWYFDEKSHRLISKDLLFVGNFISFGENQKPSFDYSGFCDYLNSMFYLSKLLSLAPKSQEFLTCLDRDVKLKKDIQKNISDVIGKQLIGMMDGTVKNEFDKLSQDIFERSVSKLEKQVEEYKKEQSSKLDEELQKVKDDLLAKISGLKSAIESEDGLFAYVSKKLDDITIEYIKSLEDTSKEQTSFLIRKKDELITELSNIIKDNYLNIQNKFEELISRINTEIKLLNKKASEIRNISSEVDKELEKINSARKSLEKTILDEVISRLVELNPVKEVNVSINDVKKKGIKGLFHQDFEAILQLVSLKMPIFLVGPAGCGKNVLLKQCSEVLGKKFFYQNDADEDHKLLGFVDANGVYHKTPFYNAFLEGGILMLDEMDNSNASVLLKLNSAIGSGNDFYMTFPNGETIKAHKDFQVVAAANTYGTGSNSVYCGRNQIDGATLDRYFIYNLDYDKNLEKALVSNKEILNLFWEVRDIIKQNDIRHTVSTRAILNMDKIISSGIIGKGTFTIGNAFDGTLIKGLDIEDLNIIVSRLKSTDKYTRSFLEHLMSKYGVDKNEYRNSDANPNFDGYQRRREYYG